MTQAIDILRDALGYLRVQDADAPVQEVDARDGLRALNMMVRRWEANGLALGWSDVAAPEDALPLPAEAEEAVGYNLAVRLASRYGVDVSPDIAVMARDGLSALRRDRMVAAPLSPDAGECGGYNIRTDGYC
jgi:hypothetical protein